MADLETLIRERENGSWWKSRRTIDPQSVATWRLPRVPKKPAA